MKALRYILIIINTIMMQSCVDMCSDGGEPIEEITVTYKNGSDENVYATIMTTTQQVTPKDLQDTCIPSITDDKCMMPEESNAIGGLTNHMFINRPYLTAIFWKESTLKRFTTEEIIQYDIYDDIYHLTYNDLRLFDYNIVYHGYSYWQENGINFE